MLAADAVRKLLGLKEKEEEGKAPRSPEESAEKLLEALGTGTFTMRLLYEQFQNLQNIANHCKIL